MSRTRVTQRVIEWVDITPPREWRAKLACGHVTPDSYNEGMDDEQKAAIEQRGGTIDCYVCGEEKDEIADLERRLSEAKAKRRGSPT